MFKQKLTKMFSLESYVEKLKITEIHSSFLKKT